MTEQRRIETLQALFASSVARGVSVGIGDDSAVLEPPANRRLVVSVDEQIEGTHFRREWLTMEDIGFRATMAAASDLAAMGAEPLWIVAALALPADLSDADFEAIARGQRAAADALPVTIVGGNLARGPAIGITTTVVGAAVAPILRAGARAGDGVFVAGALGLASLGLMALERGVRDEATAAARHAWQRPIAHVDDALRVAAVATAAIDVSDGLAKDLGAICAASGVGAEIEEASLRALARDCGTERAAHALGEDALAHVLGGGEDYALVIASPGSVPGFRRIGEFVEGERSVFVRYSDGRREVARAGFDHFAPQNLGGTSG
jgi:thiamine-monophosphate kinase